MKIALQLYSVRDCIQSGEDMRAVMKKIKAMGYEGVEFAGYGRRRSKPLWMRPAWLPSPPMKG